MRRYDSPGVASTGSALDQLREKAKFIRLETVRLARIAGAGHYSSTFSAAELLAAIYYHQLRIDPENPTWQERDRFILSKGHAAIGLYPVLADLGFFPRELLENYTRLGSAFGDHPDMKRIPGVDFSSGSLGHGLSVAVGMALAGRLEKHDFRVYCMMGDGELGEGQIWEATMAAGHFQLQSIVGIIDRNGLSIDGNTEDLMSVEPIEKRFEAFGWNVVRIDGHDIDQIVHTLDSLMPSGVGSPQLIVADTIKGRGVAMMENQVNWHVGNLVGADYDGVVLELQKGLRPPTSELGGPS